ncbi:MAG: SDR family NAD(P)-dependent oxidoreductase [Sediminicola sp.]|tara:strand:- start:8413 stop:9255 length:843 start_codon:yes stop_codon:yes gene_type:complete
MNVNRKTWFVTGASKGIGLTLTKELLLKGYNVVATSRNIKTLQKAVGNSENFLAQEVDLVNENSVAKAVRAGIEKFGSINVLVNNAGFGLIGGIEEATDKEARQSFDVNVFGVLNTTRALLSHFRMNGTGHIFNISSVFGLIAGPGWGIYCGSKFALEGISEAMAQEVKPFGINTTIIEPGYVRTHFLEGDSIQTPKNAIMAYSAIQEEKRKHLEDIPGKQLGNPQKIAEVIMELSDQEDAPMRILLGSDALQYANYKVQLLKESFEANKQITLSTDYPI